MPFFIFLIHNLHAMISNLTIINVSCNSLTVQDPRDLTSIMWYFDFFLSIVF
jgi:hypothetical protein